MEITQHTSKLLVIEEKRLLFQGLMLALFLAGICLVMGTVRYYGFQSTYRFTYWMGGLLALGSIFGYTFYLKTAKAVFDMEAQTFTLAHKKGWINKVILACPLSEIDSIRIDQKGNPPKYRLSVQHKDNKWFALQQQNIQDLSRLEKIGKHIQAFLEVSGEETVKD